MSETKLLTTKEALKVLDISKSTLRRYINKGMIKPIQYMKGGINKFKESDLLTLINS